MSITALLDRLSWIALQTRPLALISFQNAVQKNPNWQPKYRSGPKVAVAPPVPYKFLDIGTKMGSYKLGEHVPMRHDTGNIFHPRYIRNGIPPVNTFHAVVHGRAAKWVNDVDDWCLEEAWFQHSVNHDFRVTDPAGYTWGLPVLIPTCPKKLFAQGPRQKYVDIVTDTLHASSSDLITWNTLVMLKLNWVSPIPRQWLQTATQPLEAWKLIVVGTNAVAASAASQSDIEPQTIRWTVREKTDVRPTMWRFHHSSPAWKLKICIDAMKVRPVDLSSLAQETGVKFASVDLVEMAVCCLDEITAEIKKDESKDSCAASSSHSQKVDEDETSQQATPGSIEASTLR